MATGFAALLDTSGSAAVVSQVSRSSINSHSCVLCRQRKIKCDKQLPCLNCTTAQKECVQSTPPPPRRRKGRVKLTEEQLLRRLRRYEMLLKSYGAKIEDLEKLDYGGTKPHNSSHQSDSPAKPGDFASFNALNQRLQGSNSASPLHNLWTNLSDELLEGLSEEEESSHLVIYDTEASFNSGTGTFIFDPCPLDILLTHFHPPPAQIFKLWQAFLDNVNPLTKVIHAPTVRSLLLEASLDLPHASRPLEALMFAIYSCAFTSLSDEECISLTGEMRSTLRIRYHKITQQALMRARLFGTLDIMVLQAAVLFIISFRREYDPGELWILTGIVIRIGQKFGLHLESDLNKLPILEVEIRRRLWWQISVLDTRGAERSGVGASVNARLWETSRPLNVNDSDLKPGMTVPPLNHIGATEMLFPLMMYEMSAFLRHSKSMAAFDGSWQKLSDFRVPIRDKDKVIDELESVLESKFLRFCDPVIPLHILARGGVKVVMARLRLTTRHPRRYPDRGTSMTQDEKRKLSEICLNMVEHDNILHSTPSVRGFLWHIDLQSQLDAIVYLLSELRHESTGDASDKAWSQISEAFVHHHEIVTNTESPLYAAVRSLTLKSWEAREVEYRKQNLTEIQGSPPLFISQMILQKQNNTPDPLYKEDAMCNMGQPVITSPISHDLIGGSNDDTYLTFAPAHLATDLGIMDWDYWNSLMQGAELPEMTTYGTQQMESQNSTSSYTRG